jgi:hypothetical protein
MKDFKWVVFIIVAVVLLLIVGFCSPRNASAEDECVSGIYDYDGVCVVIEEGEPRVECLDSEAANYYIPESWETNIVSGGCIYMHCTFYGTDIWDECVETSKSNSWYNEYFDCIVANGYTTACNSGSDGSLGAILKSGNAPITGGCTDPKAKNFMDQQWFPQYTVVENGSCKYDYEQAKPKEQKSSLMKSPFWNRYKLLAN